jgi:hypothetical protein
LNKYSNYTPSTYAGSGITVEVRSSFPVHDNQYSVSIVKRNIKQNQKEKKKKEKEEKEEEIFTK